MRCARKTSRLFFCLIALVAVTGWILPACSRGGNIDIGAGDMENLNGTLPVLDSTVPARIETATFALG
ncbi:MAG: hypothetical protein JW954_03045 [Dehalococcoidaceae bacterium]|nr:hypothetical protein [Dehalococcoidaceae bacterium]